MKLHMKKQYAHQSVMRSAVTTFICYCAYAVPVHVPLIQVFPVMIHLFRNFWTADSRARGWLSTLKFHNTLHELVFLLVVNPTLLSLHCAI